MQSSIFEPTPPPPLPPPSGLEHYTLESPWALAVLLLAAAGVCWIFLVPTRRRQGLFASAVLTLAGLGLIALGSLIDTPRERVQQSVVGLVDAIALGQPREADALLASNAAIYDLEGSTPIDKNQILDRVRNDFGKGGRYELSDHTVLEAQVALDSVTLAKTQVKVRVSSKDWGGPYISWWRMDLTRDAQSHWQITGIQPISLPGRGRF